MAMASSKLALPPLEHSPRASTPSSPPKSPSSHSRSTLTDSQRWHHLSTRTPSVIPFIYGVLTTKIYCLPTCPSRLARRANVIFFSDPKTASIAGFRACKRCKPDLSPSFVPVRDNNLPDASSTAHAAISNASNSNETSFDPTDPSLKLHQAILLVKAASQRGEKISLAQLAKEVGLSKWHLQRAFKRRVGRSPREMGEELLKTRGVMRGTTAAGLADVEDSVREEGGNVSIGGSMGGVGSSSEQQGTMDMEDGQQHAISSPLFPDSLDLLPPFSTIPTVPHLYSASPLTLMDTSIPPDFDPDSWNNSTEIVWKLGTDPATDSTTSSTPSTVPTPLPSNMMDLDDEWNFYPDGFSPDVEGVLRDLFPEIYDESMLGERQDMATKPFPHKR